jgi:DNA-binding PadR family transcriptional regulator
MTDHRTEFLAAGHGALSAHSNVAPGTPGYELRRLERDGLMVSQRVPGVLPNEDVWRYTLTEAGRKAQAEIAP